MSKKKPDRPKKSTNAEVAKRVTEVLRIRIDGALPYQVAEYAEEAGWGVNARQLRVYMRRADMLLREQLTKSRRKMLEMHYAIRADLYARAKAAGDYRTALAVADSDAKLRGYFVDEAAVKEMMKLAKESKEKLEAVEKMLKEKQHGQATDPTAGTKGAIAG